MTRTLFLVAALAAGFSAQSVQAGQVVPLGGNEVEIRFIRGGGSNSGVDFDATWMWHVCDLGESNCSAMLSFNRTWNDRGTTLIIEREDFASYGFDELELVDLESRISDHSTQVEYAGFNRTPSGGPIQGPENAPWRVLDFEIDRFEWFFSVNMSSFEMHGTLFGTGTVVPEPTIMCLLAPLLALGGRWCRNPRNTH